MTALETTRAAGTETGPLRDAIRGAFPDWHVWRDDAGWHARRRGSWWQEPGDKAVYAIHTRHPVGIVILLYHQDQMRPPGRWDAPPRMTARHALRALRAIPFDLTIPAGPREDPGP